MFNMTYFGLNSYAETMYPFLRTGQGKRTYGLPVVGAMLIISFSAGRMHAPEMITYLYAWFVMLGVRQLTADHSQATQYQGWPWLTGWLGNETLAHLAEGVAVFFIGCFVEPYSHALGQFLMWGSLALVIKSAMEAMYMARLDDAIHDAQVDMENRARRFKRQR